MENTEEKVKELKSKQLDEMIEVENDVKKLEEFIKKNENIFIYDNKKYRIKRPSFLVQEEIEKFKFKYKLELIQDESMIFEADLKKKLSKKGIDIEAIENEMICLNAEIEDMGDKALKAVGQNQEKLITAIENKKNRIRKLSYEKNAYLEGSIEHKLTYMSNMYMTYAVLEEEIDGKWVKKFKNFDEYLNYEDNRLLLNAYAILSSLLWSFEGEE